MPQTKNDELARSLLVRAGLSTQTIDDAFLRLSVETALDVCSDLVGDRAPDENWFRDYFSLGDEHMVLTEEGWVRACDNTPEVCGDEPAEVLGEVNAPAKGAA